MTDEKDSYESINSGMPIAKLQNDMSKQKKGFLLSVNLLNKDEINILIDNINLVIEEFFTVVNKICAREKTNGLIRSNGSCKSFIVLPDDISAAEDLAYKIYSETQLYVHEQFPETYFKCVIGNIRFSDIQGINSSRSLSLLHSGMSMMHEGTFYYCYDDNPINIEILRENNKKVSLLRAALLNQKVKFVYQPIVDRITGNIHYYECLLRIVSDDNTLVSIGPIVTYAEKSGLINMVDFTVLEMVIKELVADKIITLSVNISNVGMLNKKLLERAEMLLKKHNVSNRLIIEITETSLNQDYEATKNFIDVLHKLGCRFALDDFGSGFTSFKQLLNLPIDIIKIDGSFIRDILSNHHSRFFVEALIRLAEDLGIKTVAEFVENGEIARFLIDIKIGAMQGNFFLPASDSRID
jgi:EAL domain-containing protein (putative c-di-GMP-specific phosphodiesterase class I)